MCVLARLEQSVDRSSRKQRVVLLRLVPRLAALATAEFCRPEADVPPKLAEPGQKHLRPAQRWRSHALGAPGAVHAAAGEEESSRRRVPERLPNQLTRCRVPLGHRSVAARLPLGHRSSRRRSPAETCAPSQSAAVSLLVGVSASRSAPDRG